MELRNYDFSEAGVRDDLDLDPGDDVTMIGEPARLVDGAVANFALRNIDDGTQDYVVVAYTANGSGTARFEEHEIREFDETNIIRGLAKATQTFTKAVRDGNPFFEIS